MDDRQSSTTVHPFPETTLLVQKAINWIRVYPQQPVTYKALYCHSITISNQLYLVPMQSVKPLLLLVLLVGAFCDDLTPIYNQLNSLQMQILQLQNKKPQVIRITPVDLSEAITLHQQTKSLSLNVPLPPNTNVYGLLAQIYYYHASTNSVSPGSHGYLSTKMKQSGDSVNTAQTYSRHFNWYANTAAELEIIPWNMAKPNVLEAYLYDTYNTESPGNTYGKNYFRIRLVGYLAY